MTPAFSDQLMDDSFRRTPNPIRIDEVLAAPAPFPKSDSWAPGVSVIILNLDRAELILPLLKNIEKQRSDFTHKGLTLQVIIGDTGSTDPEVLKHYDQNVSLIQVERGLKYHFSKNNNHLVKKFAQTEFILFLNNDIIFPENQPTLLKLYESLKSRPDYGVVGLNLLFPNQTVQHIGVDFFRSGPYQGLCYHPLSGKKIDLNHVAEFRRTPAVTGACLLMRHSLFNEVNGFDEGYKAECQDIALCLSARRLGYECGVLNAGPVIHIENGTRVKGEENPEDRERMIRKWAKFSEVFE